MTGQLWPTLLAEAWAALSGESGDTRLPAGLEVLWVSGAPGNLPSRLPAEDVAIACAGAALLAAAALHAQRGGDSGSRSSPVVRLDREHVAAAFRSDGGSRCRIPSSVQREQSIGWPWILTRNGVVMRKAPPGLSIWKTLRTARYGQSTCSNTCSAMMMSNVSSSGPAQTS